MDFGGYLNAVEDAVSEPEALRRLGRSAREKLPAAEADQIVERCDEYIGTAFLAAGLETPDRPTLGNEPLPHA